MNSNVYLHGIGYGPSGFYFPEDQKVILSNILKSRYLLSRRLQGKEESFGFNGMDYISLCDYEKRFITNSSRKSIISANRRDYNGFNSYVVNSIAFAFPKEEIDVIEPIIVGNCTNSVMGYFRMKELGNESERFSDMPDEVQVKDKISINLSNGITFPTVTYLKVNRTKNKIDLLKNEINDLKELIIKSGYDIPLYDIHTFEEMNEENVSDLVFRLTKR